MADDSSALTLQFSADFRQMEAALHRANNSLNRALDAMQRRTTQAEKHIGGLSGALSKINAPDVDRALGKVFDSSRMTLLAEGGARLRIFGSALEPLGAAGMTAAAGVLAASLAMDRAVKAADWAEDLVRTSHALGLTTTQLQLFDFVAQSAGVPVERMRESLRGFTEQVGRVQDGLARGRAMRLWEAIFGTSDPAKASQDLRDLGGNLDAIVAKVTNFARQLPATQRAGIAQALQVDPEVFDVLVNHFDDLSAAARRYGVVVNDDVIQRSAAAAEKMHVVKTVIDDELRQAFLDLAPAAETAAAKMLDAVTAIVDIATGAAQAWPEVQKLIAQLGQLPGVQAVAHGFGSTFDMLGHVPFIGGTGWQRGFEIALNPLEAITSGRAFSPIMPELQRLQAAGAHVRAREAATAGGGAPADEFTTAVKQLLADLKKGPHGGRAHHGAAGHAGADLGAAQERYLEALARAATSLDAAHTDRLALIQQRYADALAKALAEKGLTGAQRKTLVDTAALTREADLRQENEAYARAQAEHAQRVGDEMARFQEQELAAHAQIAGTLAARQAAERQQLLDEQAQARRDLAQRLQQDRASSGPGAMGAIAAMVAQARAQRAQIEAQRTKFATEQATEERDNALKLLRSQADELRAEIQLAATRKARARLQQQLFDNERQQAEQQLQGDIAGGQDPNGALTRQMQATIAANYAAGTQVRPAPPSLIHQWADHATDPNRIYNELQANVLSAIRSLNSGLADAIVQGKSLHDVLHQALTGFGSDLLKMALKTAEGSLFKLLGFAGGGRVPGAGNSDSVPAMLTPGERVIPKGPSGRFAPLLDTIIAGRMPAMFASGGLVGHAASMAPLRLASGGNNVHVHVQTHNDLRGVATDAALNDRLALSAERTKAQVMDAVQRALPGWSHQYAAEYGRP